MKTLTIITVLALLVSCSLTDKETTMTIEVDDTIEKSVRVISQADSIKDEIPAGQLKTYQFEIVGDTVKQFFVGGMNLSIKFAVGDDIILKVSDTGAEITGGKNIALNSYNLFKAKYIKFSWSKDESLTDTIEFKKQMDQLIHDSNEMLASLLDKGKAEQLWVDDQKLQIKYYVYNRQLSYPFMNAAYSYKKKPDVLPSFTKKVLSPEVLNDGEMVEYGQNLLGSMIYSLGKYHEEESSGSSNPKALGVLQFFKDRLSNPGVKSIVSQQLLSYQLSNYSDAGIAPILEYFTENCQDQEAKTQMLAKVEEISVLGPGKPAPEIELIDLEGNTHHLSDYKGKKVYIDVWATYCGKCLAEMPYVHEIEKDYKDKNWVFIMVSLDTDVEKWKKKAKELGNLDHQFVVRDGHHSQFNKDYRIGFAPRYIIVDSKGKLVNFNAPFPSDRKTRRIMDKVL